jgi:probable LLM family oxidoreductase
MTDVTSQRAPETAIAASGTTVPAAMEIGLYSFGEVVPDPHTGRTIGFRQRLAEVVDAAKLADEAGLDVFGIGEHHRLDFAISSTPVVMAALAQATRRIRLTSATTLLGTTDPVHVFEDFATVDLLSGGRAEVIVGRGAFTESFALFGYDLQDYDALFAEHLELLRQLDASERVTWRGRFRPPLENAEISPRPDRPLQIWVGVGGSLQSAARAGALGLPMSLAIIGGTLSQVKPTVDLYRASALQAGHDPSTMPVGTASHFYVAETSQLAREEFYPYYTHYLDYVGRGRFHVTREVYDQLGSRDGGLFVGSPQELIDKILYEYELFGHQRFLAQLDVGGLPYSRVANAIELLATHIAPIVRRETQGALPKRNNGPAA